MQHLTRLFLVAGLVVVGASHKTHAATTKTEAQPRFTYVIVHGAWAGGWEHKKVAELLEARGHQVYRPTLTGQGERVHLASPDIDLDLHIQDVVNVIRWEELDDVVLVGHSYGGMVITGVADRLPDRMKHVIYLDAFLPEDGQSLYSSRGPGGRERPSTNGFVTLGNNNNADDPPPHTVPQSAKTFSQPIALRNQEVAQKIPTSYILTVDEGREPEQDGFYFFYQRAKERGWDVSIMPGGHVVNITKPEELVERLEAIPQ